MPDICWANFVVVCKTSEVSTGVLGVAVLGAGDLTVLSNNEGELRSQLSGE